MLKRGWGQALLGLVLLVFQMAWAPGVHAQHGNHVLVLGRISDDPAAHYAQLKPLLDYVVAHMREVGITEGHILMAPDAQQMASYLRRGRVDWVTETAGTAVQLQQRSGAVPLLLTERGGVSHYHTLVFTRTDSPVQGLADLRGRTIALQGVGSTSAYLVPAAALLDAGLRPQILLSPEDQPDADTVGYVFARSEVNIAAWVDKRLVDAGALSSLDWENPRRVPPSFRDHLRVIYRSDDYPRALELVRPSLDPAVRARLRQVLLDAAHDPKAAPGLKAFFGTTRFLELDDASRQSLRKLGQGSTRVREQLE